MYMHIWLYKHKICVESNHWKKIQAEFRERKCIIGDQLCQMDFNTVILYI